MTQLRHVVRERTGKNCRNRDVAVVAARRPGREENDASPSVAEDLVQTAGETVLDPQKRRKTG
jgi:hypothetical protein